MVEYQAGKSQTSELTHGIDKTGPAAQDPWPLWLTALRPAAPNVDEVRAQLRIAGPLMLTSLVSMGMSITDVIMMGWIGPIALAAGAVASDLYSIVFYLCAGVIGAVSASVSQARGAGRHLLARRTIRQSFWATGLVALPGALAVWQAPRLLAPIGVEATIIDAAMDYAAMMAFALVPMLGVALWRQLLAAIADTRRILRVTLATLGLNGLANYALMFGKLGFPQMGLAGAGLSSALCATFMFAVLGWQVIRHPALARYRLLRGRLRPDGPRLRELFRIGLPIGVSSLGEVGVYLMSTAVIGIFGAAALAAHAVALRMAGVLYAFPLGLAQAATVRVATAAGAADASAERRAATMALAAAIAAGVAVMALVVPIREAIAVLFVGNGNPAIVAQAGVLLAILASMQVFEYLGTVAAGVLRGIKDTRRPMSISVTSFWGAGAAVGLTAAFGLGVGGLGIWIGLACGALVFGIAMNARVYTVGLLGSRLLPATA